MMRHVDTRFAPGLAAALCIILCLATGFSSLGETVQGFRWTDASGASIPFSQDGGFETGGEGRLSPERPKNRYTPARQPRIGRGEGLEILVDASLDDLVLSLALRTGSARGKAQAAFSFSPARGKSSLWIEPPAPGDIEYLEATVEDPSGKGLPADAGIEIGAIRIGNAFRGYSSGGKGSGGPSRTDLDRLHLSSGFSSDASGIWTLAGPFNGLGESPALVLAWTGRSAGDLLLRSPEGVRILVGASSVKGGFILPASLFGPKVSSISVEFPQGISPISVFATSIPRAEAELADLGSIVMSPPPGDSRDFDLYRWDLMPDVLVFDFRDYAAQDRYLKRLAFFVEKDGYRGKLATDAEIAPQHGWNAHDYRPEDLAAFFNLAADQGFSLNAAESSLRQLLLSRRVLLSDAGRLKPGSGAIISITRESADYLRRTFITHESTHALFFSDSGYRNLVTSMWTGMEKEERWFWVLYFGWMHYDVSSAYLMANEMQAYLMQQPLSRAKEYFTESLPGRLLEKYPELGPPIAAYMEKYADSFVARAGSLDVWMRARYGFGAGRTFFVR